MYQIYKRLLLMEKKWNSTKSKRFLLKPEQDQRVLEIPNSEPRLTLSGLADLLVLTNMAKGYG